MVTRQWTFADRRIKLGIALLLQSLHGLATNCVYRFKFIIDGIFSPSNVQAGNSVRTTAEVDLIFAVAGVYSVSKPNTERSPNTNSLISFLCCNINM